MRSINVRALPAIALSATGLAFLGAFFLVIVDVPVLGYILLGISGLGTTLIFIAPLGWPRFGCPLCRESTRIRSASRAEMRLDCPHCGRILGQHSGWGNTTYIKLDHLGDSDDEEYGSDS
jgi:hypothetical protein